MKKTFYLLPLMLIALTVFSACDKDDPVIPNEEEVITTLTYTLVPQNGGDPVVFSFRDVDGDGGNAPLIMAGTLKANTTYTGAILLLNEQETPAGNITEEVKAEGAEHQFFFKSTLADVSIAYADKDVNGKPLGLMTNLTTQNAGSGKLTLILRHMPDKKATGVMDGDVTNAGGETDIEVTFYLNVQ